MSIYVTSASTGSTFIWLPGGLHFIPGIPTPVVGSTAIPVAVDESVTPPVDAAPWNCTKESPRPVGHVGPVIHRDVIHLGWSWFPNGDPAEMMECTACKMWIKYPAE